MRVTKDMLFVSVMFALLAVLNITLMFMLTQQNVNRKYLADLMESTGVCTLRASGAVNTQEIPYTPQAIEEYYENCIRGRE